MKSPKRKSTRQRSSKKAPSSGEGTCTIGELAGRLRVTQRTIRFYESRGLITPRRNGAQRVYSVADETRLKLILRTKNLGFSLEDIARHLKLYDGGSGTPVEIKQKLAASRGRSSCSMRSWPTCRRP